MRQAVTTIALILFCTSCVVHKGQLTGEQCRSKKQRFKLLKSYFSQTRLLDFNKIYVSSKQSFGFGFYPDGRLIHLVSKEDNNIMIEDTINKNWSNANHIGYWRVKDDKINIEYFVCGNMGNYISKKGLIKGDTITFERDCGNANPFETIKCKEKYVLTDINFE